MDHRQFDAMQGRRVVVTGSGRGIGAAVSLDLARQGCDVALTYRGRVDAANAVAAEIKEMGQRALALQADVAEAALELIDARGPLTRGYAGSLLNLGDQRVYTHIERERARAASTVDPNDREAARLIAALRDVASGGSFGA